MTEKELQTKLKSFLERKGFIVLKNIGGLYYQKSFIKTDYKMFNKLGQVSYMMPRAQKKGLADLFVISEGQIIFIELKSDIGILKDSQKENIKLANKNKTDYFILRPKHWENFKKEFKNNQLNTNIALIYILKKTLIKIGEQK